MAFSKEKLDGGQLPLGMTWDNLYAHLYTLGDALSNETSQYTGWMTFPIRTKYNNQGCKSICYLNARNNKSDNNSRLDFQKKEKD